MAINTTIRANTVLAMCLIVITLCKKTLYFTFLSYS